MDFTDYTLGFLMGVACTTTLGVIISMGADYAKGRLK